MKLNIYPLKIIMLILAGLLLVGCSYLPGGAQPTPTYAPVSKSDGQIIVEGRVIPQEEDNLFFTTSGKVAEILVTEGDNVQEGQVLARLADRESFEAQITAAKLELTSAQQDYDDLVSNADLSYADAAVSVTSAQNNLLDAQAFYDDYDNDAYQDKIDDAHVKVQDTKDDLDDAQDEYDKYKNLDNDNADRKRAEDDLEDVQDKYDQAVREYERLVNDKAAAKASLDLAQAAYDDAVLNRDDRVNGPDPDSLALAQARLDNAQAQLSAAQAALARTELKAPFAGRIVKIDLTVGQEVVPNQSAMILADFSSWYVETKDLTEIEVVQIAVGQAAIVKPDALSGVEIPGEVESISEWYVERSGDVTYETRIALNESDVDSDLRWGMTVEVLFTQK